MWQQVLQAIRFRAENDDGDVLPQQILLVFLTPVHGHQNIEMAQLNGDPQFIHVMFTQFHRISLILKFLQRNPRMPWMHLTSGPASTCSLVPSGHSRSAASTLGYRAWRELSYPSMEPKDERRRHPRSKALKPVPVAWMYGTQKHLAQAENLSLGGLFIRTASPPAAGASIKLLFQAPEGEVRARAVVRNLAPGQGAGLAIMSMEPEHRLRLARWLQQLEREAEAQAVLE